MSIIFKIPIGVPSHAVCRRELRAKYQTNRYIKTIATYCLLKAISSTSTYKLFGDSFESTLDKLCIGRQTFLTRTNEMLEMGLAFIDSKKTQLRLVNWDVFLDKLDLQFTGWHSVSYTPGKQTAEYILKALEYSEALERMKKGFAKTFADNLYSGEIISKLAHDTGAERERLVNDQAYLRQVLWSWQLKDFASGRTHRSDAMHNINPDMARTINTVRKRHGFKSRLSVNYMETQLVKRGLVDRKYRPGVFSKSRSRKNPNIFHVAYIAHTKETLWRVPRQIEVKVPLIGDLEMIQNIENAA